MQRKHSEVGKLTRYFCPVLSYDTTLYCTSSGNSLIGPHSSKWEINEQWVSQALSGFSLTEIVKKGHTFLTEKKNILYIWIKLSLFCQTKTSLITLLAYCKTCKLDINKIKFTKTVLVCLSVITSWSGWSKSSIHGGKKMLKYFISAWCFQPEVKANHCLTPLPFHHSFIHHCCVS